MTPRPAGPERGFALIVVLWAAMLLAVIAASLLRTGRTETRLAASGIAAAELDAIVDAAINVTLLRMLDADASRRPPTDATPSPVAFAGRMVQVTVQDEAGKIDLNLAQYDLLQGLLMSAGLDGEAAQALVDKILDWREPGILRRVNGAKAEEYAAAGIPYGPRNGRFRSVEELRLVMGMSPFLFDRIAPALTVYSEAATVDPSVAPVQVLRALPGYDDQQIARLLAARAGPAAGDAEGLVAASIRAPVRLGHAFTITAEAGEADRVRVRKVAVIRLTGYANAPVWIYRWD